MIKMIALVKRKKGLSSEEFIKYWTQEHTKLSTKLGMSGYRINIALEPQPGENAPPYDGTCEIWWENLEIMQQALSSPENILAANDTQIFCEVLQFIYTQEFIIR